MRWLNRHFTKIVIVLLGVFSIASVAIAAGPPVTPIISGGTGTSTTPSYGQLPIGGKNGEYEYVASSTIGGVTSVFGRNGAVTAQSGDYNTSQVPEGSNLYFTNARAQSALSATYPIQYVSGLFSLAFGTSTSNTWGGTQTFTNAPVLGSLTGFIKAASGVLSTALISLASDVTGILPIGNGGTGTSTAPAYGQILVGNSSGSYTLTATSSLGLPNGTVTSVAASGGSTGLSFTGSPITSSGTLTLTGTLAASNGGTGSTTLTGILKGNGTNAVQTAVGGSDYEFPLTFNSPLSRAGNTISCPTCSSGGSGTGNVATSAPETAGQLAYFTTTNGTPAKIAGVATSTLTPSSPLTGSFTQIGSSGSLGLQAASASQNGYLSSIDWGLLHTATTTFGGPLSYNVGTNQVTCPTCGTSNFGATSTNPFMATYLVGTSTTATSTLSGDFSARNVFSTGLSQFATTTAGNFNQTYYVTGFPYPMTSDTIQNIINWTGGHVNIVLGYGTTTMTHQISTAGKPDVNITGMGYGTVLTIPQSSLANFSFGYMFAGDSVTNSFTLSNLTLDGGYSYFTTPPANQGGGLSPGLGWKLKHLLVRNFNYFPIFLGSASINDEMSDIEFSGSGRGNDNIGGGGGTNVHIHDITDDANLVGNVLDNVGGSGYEIDHIYNYSNHTIYLEGMNTIDVHDVFQLNGGGIQAQSDSGYNPTHVTNSSHIKMDHNWLQGGGSIIYSASSSSTDPLTVKGGDVQIEDNHVASSTQYGILVFACQASTTQIGTGINVSGNNILDANTSNSASANYGCGIVAPSGINIGQGIGVTVSGNTINDDRTPAQQNYCVEIGQSSAPSATDEPNDVTVGENSCTGYQTAPVTILHPEYTTDYSLIQHNATSTFTQGLQSSILNLTSTTASSTFANGLNLTSGCFAVKGACLASGGGGTVTQVSTDSTLTGGPITTTGTLGINLANPNTWTALQIINHASTTLFSSYGPAYFGATATSSFGTDGTLTIAQTTSTTTINSRFSIAGETYRGDLLAYWPLDNYTGVTSPDISYDATNTVTAASCVSTTTDSISGLAWTFPTNNCSATVPFSFPIPATSTNPYSVSFWFRGPAGGIQPNTQLIGETGSFSFDVQGTNGYEVYAYVNSNDFPGLRRVRLLNGLATDLDNKWHQIIINVYVDSTGHARTDFFKDGTVVVSGSGVNYTGDTNSPSGTLNIGGGAGSAFSGTTIDDIKIWNRNLSIKESQQLYYSGLQRITAGTGNYLFNRGNIGISTTTPYYPLTIISSTTAQLFLADSSTTEFGWAARAINGYFYLATSTYSATSSATALTINPNGWFGFATSSPGSQFSIQGVANFVANAISTIYNGLRVLTELVIPNSASPSLSNAGDVAINTTAASSSLRYNDGAATRSLFPDAPAGLPYASSTLSYMGPFGAAGTTTIKMLRTYRPLSLLGFFCDTDQGTAYVTMGNGTASTTEQCTSSGPWIASTVTWTMGQVVYIAIGQSASSPNLITVSPEIRKDAD